MPYLKVVPRENTWEHECSLPTSPRKTAYATGRGARNAGPGSIWVCNICNQHWMVQSHKVEQKGHWVRITAEEAERELEE